MKIGIAVLTKSIGGPRTYGINLVKKLSAIDFDNDYVIFTDNIEKFNGMKVETVQVGLGSPYAISFWDHIKLPYYARKNNLEIFHHTKNCVPFFKPCKSVVTIHDMAPFLYPETFPFHHRIYLQKNIISAAKNAERIITVSQNSKMDIVRILRVSEKKVAVIYNGVSEEFRKITDAKILSDVREKYRLGEKIILYVGTIQPRKNIDVLLKVFYDLKKEKKIEHKLVIVGRDGWLSSPVDDLIKMLSLENDVIRVRNISDQELPVFYNLSEIFIYPSSYEGFGLSILEAMACGTPVVASNLSSIPEVVGEAGILVNPRNVNEVKDAVYSLISNEIQRKLYIQRGLNRATYFSWEYTAMNVIKVYKGLNFRLV